MPTPPKMRQMSMKTMRPRAMQQLGHYRRPRLNLPGHMNTPTVGRVGKNVPSVKKFTPKPRVRRGR